MRSGFLMVTVVSLALPAGAGGSSGREFWAVHSATRGFTDGLSVLVGNPDPAQVANVTVETESGVVTAAVLPRMAHAFDLGNNRPVIQTAVERAAYRVRSDLPVHAYQYRAYTLAAGEESGALLLPAEVLGREYLVLAWPGILSGSIAEWRPSIVAVVAPGPVEVTVAVSAATQAGTGVPVLAAGATYTTVLEAFDVLQIAAAPGGDMTGTWVSATGPVEVLSGCSSCNVGSSASDSMLEVMMPPEWWGRTAVAAATNPLTTDVNRWRVLASEDGTEVVTEPVMPGTPATLARGEVVEFESTADFAVTATAPVLVGRFNSLGTGSGAFASDPAMSLMLPPERFIRLAVFALPITFQVNHLVDIVARPGTAVTLDGVLVPPASFQAVGSSGYAHAQVALRTDIETHTVEADQPVAVYATNAENATAASFPVAIEPPPNLLPACTAGGPYLAPCTGGATAVRLDGSGSSDPEGMPLAYRWSSPAPEVTFDDPGAASPLATVRGLGTFVVDLEVSDGRDAVTCATSIEVTGDGSAPPEVSRVAAPLWLVKEGRAGAVRFSWQDLGGAPVSYNVYEGVVKEFYGELPLVCNLAGEARGPGRREAVLVPGPGSVYHYVSAAGCAAEGPTGGDPARATCAP